MRTRNEQMITAYFSEVGAARNAMSELRTAGVDSNDMELRDKNADSGFLESIKRFFTGEPHEQYAGGALLTVYGEYEQMLPIVRRCGGRLAWERLAAPGDN